jgi:hypothetical protein
VIALGLAGLLAMSGLPRCPVVDIAIITRMSSATDRSGGSFTFKTVGRAPASGSLPEIPAGTRGVGIIAYADHAHGSGEPGRIVVEPRYLALPDGTHVQVIGDPTESETFVAGKTKNLNGALAYVPGLGLAVNGYNALHRGNEVTIEAGTQFRVVLGDALATGDCYLPMDSDTGPNVH